MTSPMGTWPDPILLTGPFVAVREDASYARATNLSETLLPLEHALVHGETKLGRDLFDLKVCILAPKGMFSAWPPF